MLPDIEFEGKILHTADDAIAAMKQLLAKKDITNLVELMEWMAGNDTLRPAFRDPEIVTALAEAAKVEILHPPGAWFWSGPRNNITRLMHGQPGFLENLRGDEDFSREIGEQAWNILHGQFDSIGGVDRQIWNFRHLESLASPIVDFKTIVAGAASPEALAPFTYLVLQTLDWSARVKKDTGDVLEFDRREFIRQSDREERYGRFRDYIALIGENPFLKPALDDARIAAALEVKLREMVAQQPEFAPDLVMMKEIVAKVPHLAVVFEKTEGVDGAFKNIIALKLGGGDKHANVVLARDGAGKSMVFGGLYEKPDISGAFHAALYHGQFTSHDLPDVARAERIIQLTETAHKQGWAVEDDIAALVECVDCMSDPRNRTHQYHGQFLKAVPDGWRGIAAPILARKQEAEAAKTAARPAAATGTGGWRSFLSRWGANR